MKALPKGVIVTGWLRDIIEIGGPCHKGCLWVLSSVGSRSDYGSAGYVQDVRCIRHGVALTDVDGAFLRQRATPEQMEALCEVMERDKIEAERGIKFLERKLKIMKDI